MTGWRRHLAGMFVVLFLAVQMTVSAIGLYLAHEHQRSVPFSWHMFSRVPVDSSDE